ncbi:MAG: 23S rRNA (adenine(2503)-C(2))-methyltransferase RlmN [Prevotella sp.]|nr:23S rRNA (adenine(2503)-C(2))-methyltransferase RlmN [Prevotella sp.]
MTDGGGLHILLGMSGAELVSLAKSLGMPSYAGRQIADRLYRQRTTTIDAMTELSKEARRRLGEQCLTGIMPYAERECSADGTVKYLFPTYAGGAVETVFIPDGERATLCVSCQTGCKMNCSFCRTGKQGFSGNLTAGDILNQIYALPETERLTNIVFMGQGEPMDNLDNVLKATELLQASYGLGMSPKRITISTCGIRNKLKRFIEESNCPLAISLHSARPDIRRRLMPAEAGMPITEIVALLRTYDWSHQRRLTFEYTMFRGVNDSAEDIGAIVRLLRGLDCRVNLIRFHEFEGCDFRCSDERTIETFAERLNGKGIQTTVRRSRGEDIKAACGLLATKGFS